MIHTTISTIITFTVSTLLGYTLNVIKNYKEQNDKEKNNEKMQNQALLTLLKNNLTNTYFVYSELKTIPDYAYQSFLDMLDAYEGLDGDGFVHKIASKMENWEIVKTDILK